MEILATTSCNNLKLKYKKIILTMVWVQFLSNFCQRRIKHISRDGAGK